MKLIDLFEKRSNSEQNQRKSAYEFLLQYKDNPNIYIHTTSIEKVGVNPKSGNHDAPIGVYAFRLQDVWEDSIERWNTGDYSGEKARGLEFLPYYGGPIMFVLESNIPHNFAEEYTTDDLKKDITKMQELTGYDEDTMKRMAKAAKTNLNYLDKPVGILWGMTKAWAAGGVSEFDEYTPTNEKKWAILLRKMGYDAFNDPGYGWIHGAESTQALFLTTSSFKVIDKWTDRKKKRIEIGDKSYQSVPRKLNMSSIPNTFYYNNSKEDFQRVREWNIEAMGAGDLNTWANWLPWNAKGRVGRVMIQSKHYVDNNFKNIVSSKKDILIDELFITVGDDFDLLSIFRKIPDGVWDKVNSVYTYPMSDYVQNKILEKIPSQYHSKLKVYDPYAKYRQAAE